MGARTTVVENIGEVSNGWFKGSRAQGFNGPREISSLAASWRAERRFHCQFSIVHYQLVRSDLVGGIAAGRSEVQILLKALERDADLCWLTQVFDRVGDGVVVFQPQQGGEFLCG